MPIRLLLPPSLALMTGWAWWLLPYQPSANRAIDANSEISALRVESTSVELQRSEGASSGFDPQNSAQLAAVGTSRSSDIRGSDITGIDQRLEPNDSSVQTGKFNAISGLTTGLPDSSHASQPAGVALLFSVRNFAFVCWFAIVCLLSSRLMIGYWRVRLWIKDSSLADEATLSIMKTCCQQLKLRTSLSLRISAAVWTPLVTGLFRPVILLPPAVLNSLNPRELEAVLMHELQHVIRRDFAQECILILVQVVYFFHPCVWLANRQLRRLREQACDEGTIAMLDGRRSEYGSGFVKVAELLMKPTPQLTLGIVDSDEQAASRLRRILDPKLRFGRGVSWSSLMLIVLLSFVLVPSAARQSAIADTKQVQVPGASSDPATPSTPAFDAGNPGKRDASDITTIGSANVEPFELKGQVLDVDSKPAKKAVIRFTGWSMERFAPWSSSITTDEDGRFQIWARIRKDRLGQVKVTAISADNSQMVHYRFPWNMADEAFLEPFVIQLTATRVVRLKVMDKAGLPIEKANAAIELAFPNLGNPIQTDRDGMAQFVIPTHERIESVVAWKDDVGLDYRLYSFSPGQKADVNTTAPEFPQNGIQALILDGASPISVKVVDEDGAPLKNNRVYPWLLKKNSQNDELNLSSYFQTFVQNTDDKGLTTFAWIPTWQTEPLVIWPHSEGYYRERATFKPGGESHRLEIVMKKMVPIRGHVRDRKAVPVSGANVTAAGAGYTFDEGHAEAVTDKNGAYELLVPPDQIYLVTASAKGLASNPQTGFAVFKGKPAGKAFILRKATRIHGKLVNEESREPIAGKLVYVYQYGQSLDTMKDVVLPNPENSRSFIQPIITYHATSDEKGQFELFVGDGEFDIRPPQQEKSEKFQIAGESEREFVVTTKLSNQVELAGTVKDKSTDLALTGATIFGVSRNRGGRDWQATTNQSGEFGVMQFPAATYVHAVSADKKLGAIIEVAAKQSSVALALQPVGTARGRLLTHDTKEPWGGQTVKFGVRVPSENEQTWSNRFGGHATTAADGTFELAGLVPGWKYEMYMDSRSDGTIPGLGYVQVQPAEEVKVGDVSPRPPRKPFVPPTREERIAGAFNVKGTAVERYTKSKELISLVDQHLLIVFGNPQDARIRGLMQIRFEDEEFRKISDEFLVMAVSTASTARPQADTLASLLLESLDGDRSEFLVVLLNSQGEKVDTITADQLLGEGQLSRDKLLERLRKQCPEPKDARKLLDNALAVAKQQNKRVLVEETATWCGPCQKLARFLTANRVWEKDYIWLKMDHRYTGAQKLMADLRGEAGGGIPWCAILDSDGKKLVTSNDLKSKQNIGYPSDASARAHFEHMLKSTRLRLTDDEIATLMQALVADSK